MNFVEFGGHICREILLFLGSERNKNLVGLKDGGSEIMLAVDIQMRCHLRNHPIILLLIG